MRPAGVHHFADPPAQLKRARLDNIALVPASALPLKAQWQQIANELPAGGVLIVEPAKNEKLRSVLRRIEEEFIAAGYVVKEWGYEEFHGSFSE
jgi:hypothetical protein